MTRSIAAVVLSGVLAVACGGGGGGVGGGDDDGGGGDAGVDGGGHGGHGGFVISGTVTDGATAARRLTARATGTGTVTHVMAVNPESSNPERTLAEVGADGRFTLEVTPGRPYVLVFIDSTAVGTDMVVAIFRAGTLDTLAPATGQDAADLGAVVVDQGTGVASAGIAYDDLLAALGLSADGAEFLGSIDDLSLRYANPDVDADGVIDALEDRAFGLDFHIRSNVHEGSAGGVALTIADMTDQFFASSGEAAAYPVFNLASIYALYPTSYDATSYVVNGGVSTELENGAAYTATQGDASLPSDPSSFSPLGFGDTSGWGPDYDLGQGGVELPGSGGSPATLAFTLGGIGQTLTYSNVVTRTSASLTTEGTIMPFVALDTGDGGVVTGLRYQWMRRTGAAWALATQEDIDLLVTDGGGYVSFHRVPTYGHEIGVRLPTQPSGAIALTPENVNLGGVTAEELAATTPDDICAMAVSYDDKLGLRLFAGGAQANPGVTCDP